MLPNRGIVTYLCSESYNKYWAIPQLHYLGLWLLCLPRNLLIPLTFIFLRNSAFKSRLCWEWGVTFACRTAQHVCVTAEGSECEVHRVGEEDGGLIDNLITLPSDMKWSEKWKLWCRWPGTKGEMTHCRVKWYWSGLRSFLKFRNGNL